MKRFGDFVRFCRMQLETGDYDAHIPFLIDLSSAHKLTGEEEIWLCFLYMSYYSEGSMWVAFSDPAVRARKKLPPLDLPITVQRRNLHGGKIKRHLEDLMKWPSLRERFGDPDSWDQLLTMVGEVWGNGRWATYTTSELLVRVAGLNVQPNTFEILGSSGPREGLEVLGLGTNEESAMELRDALDKEDLDVPVSVLESLLCDWAGMNKGTFYAGRNIDRQQGRILAVEELRGIKLTALWEARARVYPSWALGEVGGWRGIDSERLEVYKKRKALLRPDEERARGLLSYMR